MMRLCYHETVTGGTPMAGLRFTDLQSRPMEFLDFTSLTLDGFQQLVPPFETAFHARMAAWRMDGKPRTARRFTVEFISICGKSARGSSPWRTRSSTSVGCGAPLFLAVSSAVAASKTEAASGRWAAPIGCGPSVGPSLMPGAFSPAAAHHLIEINASPENSQPVM